MPFLAFTFVLRIWQKCKFLKVNVNGEISAYCLKFVWRQWEFAFFGASTHVGALFCFSPKNIFIFKEYLNVLF